MLETLARLKRWKAIDLKNGYQSLLILILIYYLVAGCFRAKGQNIYKRAWEPNLRYEQPMISNPTDDIWEVAIKCIRFRSNDQNKHYLYVHCMTITLNFSRLLQLTGGHLVAGFARTLECCNVVKSVVFCQTYLEVANSKLFQSLPRLTYLLSFASLFQSKSNIAAVIISLSFC